MTRDSSRRRTITALFALIWLVSVVLAYYLTHKPFTPELALELALNSWQVLIAICILSVGGGLGRRILPELQLNPLAALAVQASLGIGIISILLLFAGVFGGLRILVLGIGLILLIILLRRDILDWFRSWRSVLSVWQRSGTFGRLMSCGLLFILVSAETNDCFRKLLAEADKSVEISLQFKRFLTIPLIWMAFSIILAFPGIRQNINPLIYCSMIVAVLALSLAAIQGLTFSPIIDYTPVYNFRLLALLIVTGGLIVHIILIKNSSMLYKKTIYLRQRE